MQGERKGNRGAHSAGGKSALFIFSSLQPLSFSLCLCLPHPVISIYHHDQALLSLSHFASRSLSPPSISLSPCRPLRSPSPPPHGPLPLSFTDDLGSHSLSLPFMKLLMLFPTLPPPPLLCPALPHKSSWMHPLSADSPNPPSRKHTAEWRVVYKKKKK